MAGRQTVIEDHSLAGAASGAAANTGMVRAAMAGRVIALLVTEGQTVTQGTPLLVLEAMKMEHPSMAPMNAVVKRIYVEQGAQVSAASLLIELTPELS